MTCNGLSPVQHQAISMESRSKRPPLKLVFSARWSLTGKISIIWKYSANKMGQLECFVEIFLFIKKGFACAWTNADLLLDNRGQNSVKLESKFKPFSLFCCWPDVGPVYQASFRSWIALVKTIEVQHKHFIWTILFGITGLILGLRPANERQLYFVTTSLIGWAPTPGGGLLQWRW